MRVCIAMYFVLLGLIEWKLFFIHVIFLSLSFLSNFMFWNKMMCFERVNKMDISKSVFFFNSKNMCSYFLYILNFTFIHCEKVFDRKVWYLNRNILISFLNYHGFFFNLVMVMLAYTFQNIGWTSDFVHSVELLLWTL